MDVEITRDGLKLQGKVERAVGEKTAALIIFHGFGGDLGYEEGNLYELISQKARACGVTAVRFDFSGCGKSQGRFEDMDVLREILDAITILQYVRSLPYITDIYLLGHSQGGVIAGMLAGLYPDIVKKLILLAPAATLKTDMDVLREILDAIAILQYVRSLPYITDIYLLGHSQGGVIAGMLAGLYPDIVKKLILLAPAATLKTDAQKGVCMGTFYDESVWGLFMIQSKCRRLCW